MVREISFEKVYLKTHQFILIKMKFASHFLHQSTKVKSAKHKIFKTTSVSNLNGFSNSFFNVNINYKRHRFNDIN